MAYETLLVATSSQTLTVTLNRPKHHNALTDAMLEELHAVLDAAEDLPGCRLISIQGAKGVFCNGMDLEDTGSLQAGSNPSPKSARFFNLLKRLTTIDKVIVSLVDGRAVGGGVGLVAASDFVFASERVQFSLPEALWGLLPCSVAPFLIRRVGFRAAYAMTLSTMPITAGSAERLGLVDEVCSDPTIPLQRLLLRIAKLDLTTIAAAKRYFARLVPISQEIEAAALTEFENLFSSESVQLALARFNNPQRSFPWER
jgi:polyketide biosynthesis enoyl-CoA hydratase PksH